MIDQDSCVEMLTPLPYVSSTGVTETSTESSDPLRFEQPKAQRGRPAAPKTPLEEQVLRTSSTGTGTRGRALTKAQRAALDEERDRLRRMLVSLRVEMGKKSKSEFSLAKRVLVQLAIVCWRDPEMPAREKAQAVLRACYVAGANMREKPEGLVPKESEFDAASMEELLDQAGASVSANGKA